MSDTPTRLVVDPWRNAVPVTRAGLCAPRIVDLVFARTDPERFRAHLDRCERSRAAAIRDATVRAEFVTGRGLLRELAGQVMRIDPREVRIARRCGACGSTEHGKPAVVGQGAPHVSVAHREGNVVIALCADGPLGVDVEVNRHVPELHGMADLVLTIDEQQQLAQLDDMIAHSWFLTRWCLKEAVSKRSGVGLSGDFRSLGVQGGDAVAVLDGDCAPDGLIGAVAAPTGSRRVRWLVARAQGWPLP